MLRKQVGGSVGTRVDQSSVVGKLETALPWADNASRLIVSGLLEKSFEFICSHTILYIISGGFTTTTENI